MASKQGDGRSRRQSKDETRHMLLETGRRLLIANGYPETLNVKLIDVLKAHDLTTGAGYNIWENQGAFQTDLALYVAREYSWATIDVLTGDLPEASPLELIKIVAVRYFTAFANQQEFYVALRHWGVKEPSRELRAAIRHGYDITHENLRSFIETGLMALGRRMRADLDIEDFLTAMTASTEGFALRHRYATKKRASDLPDLYADSLLGLMYHFTEPTDDA